MPLSLRIPPPKDSLITKAATREKKTKTAFIIEAIDQKLGLIKNREKALRNFAGWLSNKEAEELRQATSVFETSHDRDWK